jgi:hypothetical protein
MPLNCHIWSDKTMLGTFATLPAKCTHPLAFRYNLAPTLRLQARLRHKHDLPRYDKHVADLAKFARLWLEHARRKQSDSLLGQLGRAARAADESKFLEALKGIEWENRSARDFVLATQWALKAGAHLAARELATKGAEIHFDSEELQKYSRVLAPPKILTDRPQSNANPKANVEWLKANKDHYKGKWVAIKDGTFLTSADTYKALVAELGNTKGRGILVTPIY